MGKVIKAIFDQLGGNEVTTESRYQYDYGMVLKFGGAVTLPQAYEVHFALDKTGDAVTQIGGADGVTVPDSMFTSGSPIYAWVYLHDGETDGYTQYTAIIPVIKRAAPSDLEPTPVQQSAIDQAIAALGVAVEQTAADVETTTANAVSASASAEAAAASAAEAAQTAVGVEANVAAAQAAESAAEAARDRAVQAETSASQSKTAAATSETNAAASEDAAQASATAAASSAAAALTSEENANGAMMSAYSDANRADTAADTATSAKNDAVTAKTAAQSAKTAAETAASTATTKASEAAASASTATTKAGEASTSATNAAASAESVASSAAQIATNTADITALKEDLTNRVIDDDSLVGKGLDIISTAYRGLHPSTGLPFETGASTYHIRKANVTPGKEYLLTASTRGRSPSCIYTFFNSSDEVVLKGPNSDAHDEATIQNFIDVDVIAPVGASYILVADYFDPSSYNTGVIGTVREVMQAIPSIRTEIAEHAFVNNYFKIFLTVLDLTQIFLDLYLTPM